MIQAKKILTSLTFNSILWLIIGAAIIIWGVYAAKPLRMYPYAAGLVFTGFGSILCGLTNGFTDQSPLGRKLRKIGGVLLIIGIPIAVYYTYRMI